MKNRILATGSVAFGLLVFFLLILGGTSIAYGLSRNRQPPIPPVAESYYDAPVLSAAHSPAAINASQPVHLRIPDIDIDTPLVNVGLNSDGTPGTPTGSNANKAAWLTTSPTPGTDGSSIIVGHVQTRAGPSIFFNLGKLAHGDQVYIIRSDGSTALFNVVAVQAFDKTSIPNDTVYAKSGDPELRLITCGGNWDPTHRQFSQNIIAYARFSGSM
jgi:LPXTG-site transpeptidase (sortase) family protein